MRPMSTQIACILGGRYSARFLKNGDFYEKVVSIGNKPPQTLWWVRTKNPNRAMARWIASLLTSYEVGVDALSILRALRRHGEKEILSVVSGHQYANARHLEDILGELDKKHLPEYLVRWLKNRKAK